MKTPEQQAQEWAIDHHHGDSSNDFLRGLLTMLKESYLAGHAAGKQEERERILAILDHGCGQAPVQFTYAELRREIHDITEEDCYTGDEKL